MPGTQITRERSTLRVRLLGTFALERDGQSLRLPRRKVEALLAYLVLHPQAHTREKLATLFWGDAPDAEARHSLRTALNTLRKHVGTDLLLVEHDTIQLNPAFPLWTDVGEFAREPSALEPYRGELLADFYEDWIDPLRERYRIEYLDRLLRL